MNGPHAMAEFVSHRGLAENGAAENTLESVRQAAAAGFEWVEVDVRITADGAAVVSHDENLGRCFGHALSIPDAAFAELRRRVPELPLLGEMLECALGLGLGVNVELKRCAGMAGPGLRAVRGAVPGDCGDRILISSFSAALLGEYRASAPSARMASVLNELHGGWEAETARVGAGNVHLSRAGAANAENCAAVKDARLGLYVFTVNDPAEHKALRENGVDGVFTDVAPMRG